MADDRPQADDELEVWRLRATAGEGWLRELTDDGPIITADRDEAAQFPTSSEAEGVLAEYASVKGRVPLEPVTGPASAPWRFGTA